MLVGLASGAKGSENRTETLAPPDPDSVALVKKYKAQTAFIYGSMGVILISIIGVFLILAFKS
jgi:hypothetical protein